MKHIVCVAHGPGSGNFILPLLPYLSKNCRVTLVALHDYVAKSWNCEKSSMSSLYSVIDDTVDLVISGTGSGNYVELELVPKLCRTKSVPLISVLDIYWGEESNIVERYTYSPTYIFVPTELDKNIICNKGLLSEDFIFVTGNPRFDRLYKKFNKTLHCAPAYTILFVSQCSSTEDYSETSLACKNALLDLLHIKSTTNLVDKIVVKPHPRESLCWLGELSSQGLVEITSETEDDVLDNYRVLVGTDSTLLYEATLSGCYCIFHSNRDKLQKNLNNLVRTPPSYLERNATKVCLDQIYKILDSNLKNRVEEVAL